MGNNKDVQIVISAKDLASDILTKIGGTLAAVFSVREIYEFGKAAVESASAQEDAEMKLAAALGRTSAALLSQASALQGTTKFSDETVISAQAQVAAFSKNEQVIRRVTAAAADFAAAKGIDLVSASEIVTKSIYGEVNMLGRYGISADGAAGSAERLEMVMRKLNDHFGGQAAAQANTASGGLAILKNSYDDLLEDIGRMITENPAVIAAMGMLKQVFVDLGKFVKDNRVWLMELVKGGIVYLIQGIGGAIEVVGFFHVAWLKLKLGVTLVIAFISEKVNELYDTMRTGLLAPFDDLFKALVDLGVIAVNPFDKIKLGLLQWEQQSELTAAATAGDLAKTANGYATVLNRVADLKDVITNIEIPAVKEATTVIKNKGDAHELTAKQIALQMQQEVEYLKALAALYRVYGATQPEMQKMDLSTFDAETNARIAALRAQNATEEAIHQEQIIRAMGRQAIVEQQLQQNESLMESLARMANNYDQAGEIMQGRQQVMDRIKQTGTNIHLAADKAMETQLLRLVETHKFSVAAIGQALAQSVKMELIAIAAKATVQALYFTAMGIAASSGPWGMATFGNPAAWFTAAADMAMVAGGALAGAAAVNLISGPGAQQSAQGTVPSNPSYTSDVPAPSAPANNGQQVTHVTVNIHNPLSTQNWDEIMELDVAPAILRAQQRGVI